MDINKLKAKIEEKSFNVESQAGDKMIVVELVDVFDVIDTLLSNSSNDQRELLINYSKYLQNQWVSVNAEIAENMADSFINSR